MKLIVGLGNPGNDYKNTRHNIGFQLVDYFALKNNFLFQKDLKRNAESFSFNFNGEKIIVIKPLSYMNLSGEVVKKYCNFYNISSSDILIVQDDLDMEFGKVRILYNSSSGGHNGIKNIIENLKTKEFSRLKIGISNNKTIDTKDYVLGKFTKDENIILNRLYFLLSDFIFDFVMLDIDKYKQKYNNILNNCMN